MGFEPIKGAVSIASNIYGVPTGYGQQVTHLVDRLKRHKAEVALLANYGLEGRLDKIQTRFGKVQAYPRGYAPHSQDVVPLWFDHFRATHPNLKHVLFTLYDVWIYNSLKFDHPVYSWVPLDHVTMPPDVMKFLLRPNVTPIAMSPHGQRQLAEAGIEARYIPHAIDTSVYKPTYKVEGIPTRQGLGVPEDAFLVTMVAANKANGIQHRKSYGEALTAFAMFRKKRPNAHLYIHAEPGNAFGGFLIPRICQALGIPSEVVTFADPNVLRVGYPVEHMAGIYTASDVLLAPSLGEGFGVPIVEAQSAGCRVITGAWTAMQDVAGPSSWVVAGQPLWDETQAAFYNIPLIDSVVQALELAYEADRGPDEASIEFAKQFDVERVWQDSWLPFWREVFGG